MGLVRFLKESDVGINICMIINNIRRERKQIGYFFFLILQIFYFGCSILLRVI